MWSYMYKHWAVYNLCGATCTSTGLLIIMWSQMSASHINSPVLVHVATCHTHINSPALIHVANNSVMHVAPAPQTDISSMMAHGKLLDSSVWGLAVLIVR